MGMTMIEKLLARAAGQSSVGQGDFVVVDVDRIVMLDLHFTSKSEPLPLKVDHPDRAVFVMDHGVPAGSVADAIGHQTARSVAAQFGIDKFYDVGRHGIVHQVLLEEGLALPGTVLACSDSHTCASGALNVAARGVGRAEALSIFCTGKTWFKVAPTIAYDVVGRLRDGVYGKDVFLWIADKFGDHTNKNVEFGGSGLASLNIDDRATIATMCAEISAEFATFPADEVVLDFLEGRAKEAFEPVVPDADARYEDRRVVQLDSVEPYVALPGSVPNNTKQATAVEADDITIDQAFVGSCANGKLGDLRIAAEIVDGLSVHPDVRFLVTPASQRVYLEASKLGYIAKLVEAGAVVTQSTCGACLGYHNGVLAPGERCITSSTRNFKGRMGSPQADIFIGSSATVAASAIAGRIVDPRPFIREYGRSDTAGV